MKFDLTSPRLFTNDMKTKIVVCAIVLLTPFFGASAQSGRVVPKPTPTPSPELPKPPEAKPKFVVDPNGDRYKLLFSRGYEDKLLYKDPPKSRKEKKEREKEREKDADRRIKAYWGSFIEQINQAGDQGYRIISTAGQGTLAIARLDEVRYEYALFDTGSNFFFAKGSFEEKYAELSKQGFSLVDHLSSSRSCESENTVYDEHGPVPQIFPPRCEYHDRFLVEREKGVDIPRQFRLVRHVPRWRALKGDATLTTQVNDYLAVGLYPTHALSKYEILLQPTTAKEKLLPDELEMQVFTGNMQKMRKKVNELAQQGYRLALTQYETAVMYRRRDVTTPVSYVWLDVLKKESIETRLAHLQRQGAIYRMIYTNIFSAKPELVFEQPIVGGSQRHEYKVLEFELNEVENVAQKKVDVDLTPLSKESVKTLNSLVKEGFEIRGLLDLGIARDYKIGVFLERSR